MEKVVLVFSDEGLSSNPNWFMQVLEAPLSLETALKFAKIVMDAFEGNILAEAVEETFRPGSTVGFIKMFIKGDKKPSYNLIFEEYEIFKL